MNTYVGEQGEFWTAVQSLILFVVCTKWITLPAISMIHSVECSKKRCWQYLTRHNYEQDVVQLADNVLSLVESLLNLHKCFENLQRERGKMCLLPKAYKEFIHGNCSPVASIP
ncbi:hypothetical protein M514_04782 [Trichuris suis]|uniref:Uncharacterized protein n=1 Tax=Trichuris suis TaxID=68888 RepID=A0A085MAJ4_9BILA|nr:hypothetical protein M513_04782 [Trichuris suis]KFD73208.1 hypothetical protein M514_04782 [Trichuris suis]